MRFGPTSLQVSSVLAKGLRRPKLRSDLRISEQTIAGETSYVIKVAETNSYNRYGSSEYELLTLCDGTRAPAEIAEELTKRHPDEPLQETEVLEFLDGIEPATWERSLGEKNLAVLARIRDERKSRIDQSSVLYLSFKAWDPDKVLTRLDPYLSWMFTPGFVLFSVALFIATLYLLASDWTRIQHDTVALYSFADKTSYDIWAFWFLLFGLGGIHEFGHGLTCKHFGGEVHQMGFMLIYFTPAFYTDTTDILLFDRGSRRQWVIFAGMWIELVVCGIATLIWHFTLPGSLTNDLAYKALLLSGISGTLLNLDPLIKADGYYALSQFLSMDNLREDSFAFLRAWARKYLLRDDLDLPDASRRQRRIYLVYGIVALIYGVALVALSIVFVKNVLVSRLGRWGYPLTGVVAYLLTRKRLRKTLPAIRAWVREKKEEYMAWKITRTQQVGFLGALLVVLLPPVPSRVVSDLVLEPGKDARIRAAVPGAVRRVLVRQGDEVKAGQVLALLGNPEIEADAQLLTQQLALADGQVRDAQGRSDLDKAPVAVRERTRLHEQLAVAERKLQALEIRALFDGVVKTPEVEQKAGEYLAAGDEFCQVVYRRNMKARILVRDSELEQVGLGTNVQVKVRPFPYRMYSGRIEQILPAAAADRPVAQPQKFERMGQELTNYFAVVMDFPNPDASLREGMTGTAKISGKSYPLAWQAARAVWRWLRSQIW
jgi:putative peptide zinc metalloprotease protein